MRMKKLINKLTDAKKPANLKEWKHPLLPMFYTLKVLGRLPFEKDESGNLNIYNYYRLAGSFIYNYLYTLVIMDFS